jgi:hypothetical protein
MTFALVIITSSAHCQLLSNFQQIPFFQFFALLHLLRHNAGVLSYFCWQIATLIDVVFMLHLSSHLCLCLHLLFTSH